MATSAQHSAIFGQLFNGTADNGRASASGCHFGLLTRRGFTGWDDYILAIELLFNGSDLQFLSLIQTLLLMRYILSLYIY